MKTKSWKAREPLTDQEMKDLITSVSAHIKPSTPCAKYKEVMNMKSKYQSAYGVGQLAKDCELAQQRLKDRGKDGNSKG